MLEASMLWCILAFSVRSAERDYACNPAGPAAAMEVLDGDTQRIRSPEGSLAARDMVQFVPLRQHQRVTVEELAAQLLAELPGQVGRDVGLRGSLQMFGDPWANDPLLPPLFFQVVEYFNDLQHTPPRHVTNPPPAMAVGEPTFPRV